MILVIAIIIVFCTICFIAARQYSGRVVRLSLIVFTFIGIVIAYTSIIDSLSKPKRTTLELIYSGTDEAFLISSVMLENKGIFLWLQIPEVEEPRYYVMEWNEELAKELREAMKLAKEQGSAGVLVRRPFKMWGEEEDDIFHPIPQDNLPPKMGNQVPEVYRSPTF